MASYFQNFTLLMKRLSGQTYDGIQGFGKTTIVHVEPDLSGYAEQAVLDSGSCYGHCSAQGNNPAYLSASVAGSGNPDVTGYPNTYQGFNWALLHLRDLYAPNVLLAFHVSDWATRQDVGSSSDPSLNAASLGQEAGSFAAQSGTTGVPAGTSSYDLLFNDVLDRDAAYYKYVYGDGSRFWDRLNVTYPNFHRWESYVSAASQAAGRPFIIWQIPEGNQYFDTENNTNGHYQDNRAEYFFSHIAELAQSGIIGLLFGAGNGGSTVNSDGMGDGITNPPSFCTSDGLSSGQICNNHTSTISDDDGGYLRLQGQQYYASGGYPLGGNSPSPTPTGSATATPPASPTSTDTATPTATSTPMPTDTATATPTSTVRPPLILGNFENSTDGFGHNSNVTNMTPSTWSPAVALGQYALRCTYKTPSAGAQSQVYKAVNANLSAYGTLSASVYAVQPGAPGAAVQVRFQVLGSNNRWYSSPFQTLPNGVKTKVSWNISGVPRNPLKQLYVTWRLTTSGTGTGNQVYLDDIQASP